MDSAQQMARGGQRTAVGGQPEAFAHGTRDAVRTAAPAVRRPLSAARFPLSAARSGLITAALLLAAAPVVAFAQATPPPVPGKADTVWMLVSTLLVILMAVPGLALFYGGMVRAKNMLSVLMQVFVVFSLLVVLWVAYGYSLAFTGTGQWIGGLDHLLLAGITPESTAATFTDGVVIPEFVFVAFQATFAAITACLIVGSFAERVRFSAVLIFMVIWFTFCYLPIARMVWYGEGFMFKQGALDFAGGTVVHINAGIAGLVGALVVGKRIGYGTTAMPPHNLPMVMIGASLLWVGWFGFNVGSNLEASAFTGLVFLNTFVATAAAVVAWIAGEWIFRGQPTMLGAASGAVAGLVAITPSCGFLGIGGALLLGLIAGFVCLWACAKVKVWAGYDDSLDVFGVHAVGGIVGAILTGVLVSPTFGGTGLDGYHMGHQVWVQTLGVSITIGWSATVAFVAYKIADLAVGLRVSEEQEREGLDTTYHGERAYQN
ncbi:MAG: Ammonia channel [Steroidobacteraceae bacterium]|nr:Ammonia channel [Steroidobacteraceae bacterium]